MSAYLLLFPELHLHLFVTRLVLADAVAGDEVAADVSEFWVLFPRLFDQTEEDTSVRNSVFNRVLVLVKLGLQHRGFMPLCTSRVCVPELWDWIIARPILWCYSAFNHRPSGHWLSLIHHFIMFDIYMLNHILIILWILELRPNMCFVFCVKVILTSDHQILLSSSLSYCVHLYEIWRNSLEMFLRFCRPWLSLAERHEK